MHFTNILKSFESQWNTLKENADADNSDASKITWNLSVTRKLESFIDFLNQLYGVRNIHLSYVTRKDKAVRTPALALAHHQPHSYEHRSVEVEMIERLSHTHPIFRDDNKSVYHDLEATACSIVYTDTLKLFQRANDVQSAHEDLSKQNAGGNTWEKEIN